jgi:hypothetical protein
MALFFLIETFVLINNIEVSRFLVHFVGIFLITYLTKKNVMGLFSYHNVVTLFIVTADIFLSRYLINSNFDNNLEVFDAAHSMLIVIISIFSLSFINFADISELETSAMAGEHRDLIATALVYKVFNFYKLYYYDTTDMYIFIKYCLIEFVINNAFFMIYSLLDAFKNKNCRLKLSLLIFKRILFMMIARLIYRQFYLNNNNYLEEVINNFKNFFFSKLGLKETISRKNNYFNLLVYTTFTLLELIK